MQLLFQIPTCSSASSTILLSLLISILFNAVQAVVTLPNNETIPAVIVFGDSIVDPGNNNHLLTLIKSNFSPYGRDFMGGQPTGRFSNGKIPSDFLVEELGIKELLPAYLDANLQTDLSTGVSFASGASGYDPLTAEIMSVLSLPDQLELFKEYKERLKTAVGEERTTTLLSKALFIVVAGSDDIANTYFGTPLRSAVYDAEAYTDLMVDSASSFLQELYGLGARRIGVFGAPPIGCLPIQRTAGGGIQRRCAEERNQVAELFNTKLYSKLESLSLSKQYFPHARLVYIDIYNPLHNLIQNPAASGFEVVDRGCCGTGEAEVSVLCKELSPLTCTDASKYVFWDSYHPTERAYKLLLSPILRKYVNSFA